MSMLSKTLRRILPTRRPGPVVPEAVQRVHSVEIRGQKLQFPYADETAQYEPQLLDYLDRLPPGAVYYDLGACVGFFALYASARGLDTHAFEIESQNYSALVANVRANPNLSLRTYHIGVSDGASDWADLRIGQNRPGGHHKTVVSDVFSGPANIVQQHYATKRVRVAALDDLIDRFALPAPEHIKIDIDGSEVLFLRGAGRTLASSRTRSLMFELFTGSPYFQAITEQLASYGFRLTARHPIDQPWPGCEQLFNCEFWK